MDANIVNWLWTRPHTEYNDFVHAVTVAVTYY